MSVFNRLLDIVFLYIVSIPFVFILVLIHEIGHAVVVLIGGGKPQIFLYRGRFKACPRSEKSNKKITICNFIYPGGRCEHNFKNFSEKSLFFWLAFCAAGAIAQLIVMGVVGGLSIWYWGYLPNLIKLFLGIGSLGVVSSLIPHRILDSDSDGKLILDLIQRTLR
ncbi:hypothetical protein ACR6HW_17405 [Fusibacter sp. JL298sf-3]